jgi:hypothetical protein
MFKCADSSLQIDILQACNNVAQSTINSIDYIVEIAKSFSQCHFHCISKRIFDFQQIWVQNCVSGELNRSLYGWYLWGMDEVIWRRRCDKLHTPSWRWTLRVLPFCFTASWGGKPKIILIVCYAGEFPTRSITLPCAIRASGLLNLILITTSWGILFVLEIKKQTLNHHILDTGIYWHWTDQ